MQQFSIAIHGGAGTLVKGHMSPEKEKAYKSALEGATIVCLLPSRTDTRWCHDYCMKSKSIHFVKGRLKFGNSKNSAPFPSVVVVFSPKTLRGVNA